MIFVHCSVWLVTREDVALLTDDFLVPQIRRFALLGLFPLMLPALAGSSFYAYLRRSGASINSNSSVRRISDISLWQLVRVFLFFIGLGFLTNLLSWGPSVSFDWDVLGFIGLCWLVMAALLRVGLGLLIDVLALGCLMTSPWLTDVYGTGWFGVVLFGSEHRGAYWPFFPWFAVVAFGFRLTEWLWFNSDRWPMKWGILFFGGGVSVVVSMVFSDHLIRFDDQNVWGAGVFKPGIAGIVAVCGVLCLMIAGGAWWLKDRSLKRYGFINCLSTGILWIYVVHQIVGANLSYWLKKAGHLPMVSLAFFAIELALSFGVGVLAVYLQHHRIRLILRKSSTV